MKKKKLNNKLTKECDWYSRISMIGISIIVLHFLFLFIFPAIFNFPEIFKRTWGFHHISYFSMPYIILFYLIGISVCIPQINKRIVKFFEIIFSENVKNKLKNNKCWAWEVIWMKEGTGNR